MPLPSSCALLAAVLVSAAAGGARPAARERPNVVLVVLDDMGLDKLGAYCSIAPELQPPCTPNIDALAARGVLFRQAYASPLCSPTRAQILTGRYGFRTGIGGLVDYRGLGNGLSAELERTLPEVLEGYDSSLIGKWHLADVRADGLQHPLESGFRYFAGTMFNLGLPPVDFGEGALDCSDGDPFAQPYSRWVKTCDPEGRGRLAQTCAHTYATTDAADEAIARARAMEPPWFLELAFHAPHTPLEAPPPALCAEDACAFQYCRQPASELHEVANAMIEGLDHELGRFLAELRAVDPAAYVFLVGDNGTDPALVGGLEDCFAGARSKGRLYQPGIRVPLIVAGPDVTPGTCDELVSAVDLFATIVELSGAAAPTHDSVSFVPYLRGSRRPLREAVYAELFQPNFVTPDSGTTPPFIPRAHTRAILNKRFKLIRYTDAEGRVEERLYDLDEDPCEQRNLCRGFGPADPELLTPLQAANLQVLQEELLALGAF